MESASIMVVEDDRIVARDIQGRLEGLDYRVPAVVATGEEAIEQAHEEVPDLVLMDIRLSGRVDGIEAARRICEHRHVPVVYLTAYSDDETLRRASYTDAYGYVLKPCETRRLQAAIEIALRKHNSEKAQRRKQNLLCRLFEELPMALLVVDPDGRLLLCNGEACKLLDLDPGSWKDRDLTSVVRLEEQDGRSYRLPIEKVLHGEKKVLRGSPLRLLRRDGQVRQVEFCWVPVRSSDGGETLAAAMLLEDVSTRRGRYQQAIHAESFRMISQTASGIAHHYNNLLTVIEGYSRLLQKGWQSEQEVQDSLDRIVEASRRATKLTSQLMSFSRDQTGQPQRLSLHGSLGEALEMVQTMLPERIEVEMDLRAARDQIQADPSHLRETWAQALLNSRDAMPDGGRIHIATRSLRGQAGSDDASGEEGWIEVSIRDTGVGMDEGTRQRAFDPFFTTKEVGQGVGLGLATVYCHIRQMGGTIALESSPRRGTTLKVCLPVLAGRHEVTQSSSTRTDPVRPEGVELLVVDDEESLRSLAQRLLSREGYEVTLCGGGAEAVELLRQAPGRFDAALLDMIMPGMDGAQTAEALRKIRPDLAIVFTSGCDASSVLEQIRGQGNSTVLPKPWQPAKLLEALQTVLAFRDD
jgi:hypothetical protein